MKVRPLPVALAATLAACASHEKILVPSAGDVASAAVGTFSQLADSVSRAGGDTALSGAYASIAEAILQGGRVSPITVVVDGVAAEFMATAQVTEFPPGNCGPLTACATKSLRSLIAFNKVNPKQIVQLASAADSEPIRAYIYPVLVPFNGPSASLVYMDGKGGSFFGTSGAQKFAVSFSGTPCAATSPNVVIAIYPAPPACRQADFTISFDARAEPSSFLATNNTATGSHTFSMSSQPVLGARFQVVTMTPPAPPIGVSPSASLPATLSARVDSLVTLTLTVTNPASSPVQVTFTSGQRYDFTIVDASTGAALWRWSAARSFAQVLSTQSVPANGSLVFTEAWKPTARGNLIAIGSLVSASHRADAKIALTLP